MTVLAFGQLVEGQTKRNVLSNVSTLSQRGLEVLSFTDKKTVLILKDTKQSINDVSVIQTHSMTSQIPNLLNEYSSTASTFFSPGANMFGEKFEPRWILIPSTVSTAAPSLDAPLPHTRFAMFPASGNL
jgi:hypothetical protein